MIEGSDILRLVRAFKERNVKLYHACQLLDLESYLRVGGIPSRQLLQRQQLSFTPFDTDEQDKANGVWDMVFANLSDFGQAFANGNRGDVPNGFPNPYGPVLLVLDPTALETASDVAICLTSAGGRRFDRCSEAIALDDVDRLFLYPRRARSRTKRSLLRHSGDLAEEFGRQEAHTSAPEISCAVAGGRFPLSHVRLAVVDPYVIGRRRLVDRVKDALQEHGGRFPAHERDTPRAALYRELAELLQGRAIPKLDTIATGSAELRAWARALAGGRHRQLRQWPRYANYLRDGTLDPAHRQRLPPRCSGTRRAHLDASAGARP